MQVCVGVEMRKNSTLQKTRQFFVFAFMCLILLSACQKNEEQSAELFVFGTIVEVKLWGASPEEASHAFTELQKMFQDMHRDWHAWEPGRLTEINKAFEQGQSAVADEDIVIMIQRSQVIEELSAGRFNPTIGALIRLWGFHTSELPHCGLSPCAGTDQCNS